MPPTLPGNAAQAFDAGAAGHHGSRNKLIPGLARAYVENNIAVFIVRAPLVDAWNRNFQHQSGPAGIGHYQIAAAA